MKNKLILIHYGDVLFIYYFAISCYFCKFPIVVIISFITVCFGKDISDQHDTKLNELNKDIHKSLLLSTF